MSLCVACSLRLAGDADFCPHHFCADEKNWAAGNRIRCDFFHRKKVPSRLPPPAILKIRVVEALTDAALPAIGIDIGEDDCLRLHGEVDSEDQKAQAERVVASVFGVSWITNDLELKRPLLKYVPQYR
ncbi:MAG: BON domain-containing protein [bacterium]|nr:BON domain-containing protein [bacterium]